MQNISFRNILVVVGLVIIALIVLGIASTLLTAIVPLTITAAIAFILGRLSVNVDVWKLLTSRWQSSPKADTKAAKPAQASNNAEQKAASRIAEPEINREALLLKEDFEVKTPEQVEAEARRREQELKQNASAANTDVAAALEERRRRLLGGQSDQS